MPCFIRIIMFVACLFWLPCAAVAGSTSDTAPLVPIDFQKTKMEDYIRGDGRRAFAITYYYLPADCAEGGYPRDGAMPLAIDGPLNPALAKKIAARSGKKPSRTADVLLVNLRGEPQAAILSCKGKDDDVTCEASFKDGLVIRMEREAPFRKKLTISDGKETRSLSLVESMETFD